jgi:hypothetical protein
MDPCPDAKPRGQAGCDIREALPGAQSLRSDHIRRQITVSDLKPGVLPVPPEHLECAERISFDTPPDILPRQPGECVHHRVEIGADMEAKEIAVIGRVYDQG